VASKTALAMAAAVATEAPSPAPEGGTSGRFMRTMSIAPGASGALRMGYVRQSTLVTVEALNCTSSMSARLVDWIRFASMVPLRPSGLITSPQSWAMTSRVTYTRPVAWLTSTSATAARRVSPRGA